MTPLLCVARGHAKHVLLSAVGLRPGGRGWNSDSLENLFLLFEEIEVLAKSFFLHFLDRDETQ
jgi:hypothetical protein